MMQTLDLSAEDVEPYTRFDDDRYRRNLMHEGSGFQALVLCWKPGQRSPIHDHRGSSCGVRVLRGVATETIFQRGRDGMLAASRSHQMATGEVCGSEDMDIHQVSNLSRDEPLVTLHVYSPPLLRMGTYSLTDSVVREFEDPIYEFCHGAGI
jgi:cysteine dioxygenase